ncbi:unnamed protein product [Closterium sp. Yama58-4]|nr:unnamed protein product [Closterium sp. Yama58-4]
MSPAVTATSAAMNTTSATIRTASEPWEEAINSQLAAWFDDSHWTDEPPSMTVTVGDHGRGQLDGVATVALPPDAVFSILCDPHNRRVHDPRNRRVFTFIKSVKNERVVSDCNGVRVVELDIVFALKVPFFTGTFDAHLRNVHDRPNRRVTFCLSRPGFMRKFEGFWQCQQQPGLLPFPLLSRCHVKIMAPTWGSIGSASSSPDCFPFRTVPAPTITSVRGGAMCGGLGGDGTARVSGGSGGDGVGMRVASRLVLHQVVQPSLAPPPMFRRCVHALLKAATRDVLVVFQYEAARIRNSKGNFLWKIGAEAGAGEGEGGKGKVGKSSKLGALFLHKEALGGKKSGFGTGKGGFGLKKPAQRKS